MTPLKQNIPFSARCQANLDATLGLYTSPTKKHQQNHWTLAWPDNLRVRRIGDHIAPGVFSERTIARSENWEVGVLNISNNKYIYFLLIFYEYIFKTMCMYVRVQKPVFSRAYTYVCVTDSKISVIHLQDNQKFFSIYPPAAPKATRISDSVGLDSCPICFLALVHVANYAQLRWKNVASPMCKEKQPQAHGKL